MYLWGYNSSFTNLNGFDSIFYSDANNKYIPTSYNNLTTDIEKFNREIISQDNSNNKITMSALLEINDKLTINGKQESTSILLDRYKIENSLRYHGKVKSIACGMNTQQYY